MLHPFLLVVPAVAAVWLRRRPALLAAAAAVFVAATLPFERHAFVLQTVQLVALLLVVAPLVVLSAKGAARTRSPVHLPPVAGWVIAGAAVVVLYWSGQYRLALEHPAVWQLTQLELVAVGCVFALPVLGARRVAIGWRVTYVLFGLLFWSVVGLALESQHAPIAPGISVAALHTGAGDLWTIALLLTILATIGLVFEWLFVDLARARRADVRNAEEDARQLALWRAARREAALADVRASQAVAARSRPAGTDRSEGYYRSARWASPTEPE